MGPRTGAAVTLQNDHTGNTPTDDFAAYLSESNHTVRIDGQFGWSSDWRY